MLLHHKTAHRSSSTTCPRYTLIRPFSQIVALLLVALNRNQVRARVPHNNQQLLPHLPPISSAYVQACRADLCLNGVQALKT